MITGEPSEAYDKQRRTREIVDLLFYTLPVSGLELDWMCGLLGAPGSETLSSVVPKETSKQKDKIVVITSLPSYIDLNLGFRAVALVQVIVPRADNLFLN
ncbi:hypothetical protein Y032_0077g1133 [Ancylostoma ceylanicum]|uniref:Uncharacterized protein n=1 Tax=Ancylostoma ceylanicum TaxID=53326 RepID=A0A016TUI4_9BILA|nr:hypothetical protein Y032_0077g1133 [Ancylostoma ceylanicum]